MISKTARNKYTRITKWYNQKIKSLRTEEHIKFVWVGLVSEI